VSLLAAEADKDASSPAPSDPQAVGELVVSTSENLSGGAEKLVLLVHGPPMSGKSTQATLLGSRYGVPVVTIFQLLEVRVNISAVVSVFCCAMVQYMQKYARVHQKPCCRCTRANTPNISMTA
jgi:hypothetical protein